MSGTSVIGLVSGLLSELGQTPVMLGSFAFVASEVPSQIRVGGRQIIAIHRLPGGARVIDAMGPDENAIQWTGCFTGPLAVERARILDGMRGSGLAFSLSFADYVYSVVIVQFDYLFRDRGAILQYRIRMEVVAEPADQGAATSIASLMLVGQDISSALASLSYGQNVPSEAVQSALLAASAAARTADSGGSLASLPSVLSTAADVIRSGIVSAGSILSSGSQSSTPEALTMTCNAAGALAGAVRSAGYINRANGLSGQLNGLQSVTPLIYA